MSKITPASKSHCHPDYRYFTTRSLYLAAYLYAHGLWLSNSEKLAGGTYRFVFRDSVERGILVRRFQKSPKALVDARTFAYALEELRRRAKKIGYDVTD